VCDAFSYGPTLLAITREGQSERRRVNSMTFEGQQMRENGKILEKGPPACVDTFQSWSRADPSRPFRHQASLCTSTWLRISSVSSERRARSLTGIGPRDAGYSTALGLGGKNGRKKFKKIVLQIERRRLRPFSC